MSTIVKKYYMAIDAEEFDFGGNEQEWEHIVILTMEIPRGCENDEKLKATFQQIQKDWREGELLSK